ncbi:hypothetical protein ILUMI_07433 [Ignelater luminosus]|uniref:DDE Tnp4 domain-containing protein n=1 Tax=Ignelater luminosus TaxID=2038154 RepID=A0A8K0GBM0_IGNLU|nr:hypothetical protein ILUMI_07433 [Ignelater luminosus]
MSSEATEINAESSLVSCDTDNQTNEIKNVLSELNNKELLIEDEMNEEVFKFLKGLLEAIAEEQDIDGHLISVDTQVYLALHFLITGKVGDKFENIPQNYVNNYVMNLINCLIRTAPQFIKFPIEQKTVEEEFYALGKNENGTGFPHVLGIIGNTYIQLKKPNHNPEIYLNSNHQYSVRIQIVCGPDLQIYNILAAFPGGCENLFIWENSNLRRVLEDSDTNPSNNWLLGNFDYPQEPWLMIPIASAKSPSEELYNKVHNITSQPVKKCIETLKVRFRCLQSILDYDPPEVFAIVTACCVLNNIYICYKDSLEIEVNLQESESSCEEVSTSDLEEGLATRKALIENYFTC